MFQIFLLLLLFLLLIYKKKQSNIIYQICFLILIIGIYDASKYETFKNKKCPEWEGKCYNRSDCGWCIDKKVNGKCVKGNKKGPKNKSKKKCASWWYKGNCIYGKQCPSTIKRIDIYKNKKLKDENWEEIFNEEECIELDEEDMVP
jgi:hypothetical protein